jgi:aspartate/tyrosine/aromatic aminotransferase
MYSSPSRYGAEIASQVLCNKANFEEWESELRDVVSKRITDMRGLLRQHL